MNIEPMDSRPESHQLHAYVDGRLDEAQRRDVENWLAAHPEQAALIEDWKRDAARLRTLHAHPERWEANPALDPGQIRGRLRARRRARLGVAASMLLAFGVGGGVGWKARELRPAAASLPMADAVAAYRQFVVADAPPMEFDASRSRDLHRWLQRNFGEAGRVPDLSAAGFRLAGGRLLSTEQGAAALLLYQDGSGARVGFYMRPPGPLRSNGERHDGDLLAQYWSRPEISFAVVGKAGDLAVSTLPRLLGAPEGI